MSFAKYIEEKKLNDILFNLRKKLSSKLLGVVNKIITSGILVGKITIENIDKTAEKLGIELTTDEIFHIFHVMEELGHELIHLISSNQIDFNNYLDD